MNIADFKGVWHGLARCGVQRRAWLPAAGQRLPGRRHLDLGPDREPDLSLPRHLRRTACCLHYGRHPDHVHHRQSAGIHCFYGRRAHRVDSRGRHLQAADGRCCGVLRRRGRAVHPVPAAPSVAAGGLQRCAVGAGPV